MITKQILQSIDNINEAIDNSSYAVLESMCTLIEKEYIFEEFCSPDFIQEGEMLDNVKKKGKKDSNRLITILMFLPRLLAEIGKSIKKFFSDADLGDKIKDAGEKLAKGADIAEKKARVAIVNKENDGKFELYVDDKGEIKVKKDSKVVLGTLAWLAGTTDIMIQLFKGISDQKNLADPSKIRNFVDECEKVIHMKSDKKFSEIADMGLDALGDMVGLVTKGTASIAALCAGAKTACEVRLSKIKASGEDPDGSIVSGLSSLLSKLTVINAAIAGVGATISTIKHIGEYITPAIAAGEQEVEDTKEASKRANIDIDEIKKNNPKKDDESDEEYNERLTKIATKEKIGKINEEKKNVKKERSEKEKAEYDKAAAEYKAKKKEVKESPTIFDKKKKEKDDSKKAKKKEDKDEK